MLEIGRDGEWETGRLGTEGVLREKGGIGDLLAAVGGLRVGADWLS